jgi:hypothetical protein
MVYVEQAKFIGMLPNVLRSNALDVFGKYIIFFKYPGKINEGVLDERSRKSAAQNYLHSPK